ncbi:hypothetical protein Tco_1054650 [Tanacetum coccineum]|uniref:Uncharacterized protein n=1 Tax=Tanacetum coccineum TaxID=301880 RepID=A0ABQ5GXE0_9ASTR
MDTKSGIYNFQLDELWFTLDADLLRSALGITHKDYTHPFVAPPAGDPVIDFVNNMGYHEELQFVSKMYMNSLYQPWRTILFMINQCLTGKTSGSDRPRHPVLQILWGVVSRINIDYAELICYFDLLLRSRLGAVDGLDGTERGYQRFIMGEPLSTDCVFDFPMDEPEPHPVYDFFAPGPLPGYAGNPNNANGWIKADVPLLGEMGKPLGAEADEPMVGLVVDEIAEPIVEMEEQMVAPVVDMEGDLAMLFGDDDSSDDSLHDDEEVWEVNEEWLMAPVTPHPMPVIPSPRTYKVGGPSTAAAEGHSLSLPTTVFPMPPPVIEDLCTRMGNLEYGHGQLVKKVIQVSDAEVADGIVIGEIGPRFSAVEGQGQQAATQRDETIEGLSQQVQTLQATVQHRDAHIQQLQALVSEMSSRESTLMQCILGMDKRLADLERRPSGP